MWIIFAEVSTSEFGVILSILLVVVALAHACGHVFVVLRQPRVIGEIVAGILVGPALVGRMFPHLSAMADRHAVTGFLYQLGLLLLMFVSGAEVRGLFDREERRAVAWLACIGTGLPFVIMLLLGSRLPLNRFAGTVRAGMPLLLVIGIAVSVTSIPVISRILYDLKILQTRFARLVLGVAVIEDIGLWAVLAAATTMAQSGAVPQAKITMHVVATLAYFVVALLLGPALVRSLGRARFNIVVQSSPIAYVITVLFAYSAIAAVLDISLVFAAFLAGFAVARDKLHYGEALRSLAQVAFAVFIPIYFVAVGYKLDFTKDFSLMLLAISLAGACALKLLSMGLGAKLAGFRGLEIVNLAVATNARGGPGIVLASVAYDAGIINSVFYTTLVLVAVVTSQAAGAWLNYVLKKGLPLLSAAPVESAVASGQEDIIAA